MEKNAPVNSTQAQFAGLSRQSGLAAPKPLRRRRVKPMLLLKMPGKYMQSLYNEHLTTQTGVVTVPAWFDLVRPGSTKKNKSKMLAQDVKNFDRMCKMNRILKRNRVSRPVKPDHNSSGAQSHGQIVCKSFNMNDLEYNRRSARSKSVKVRQTCFKTAKCNGRPFVLRHSLVISAWTLDILPHIYASRYIDF